MPLVSEIKKFFKKTILLSRRISTVRDMAFGIQMGVDLAYIGHDLLIPQKVKCQKLIRI
tara:strand:+ start:257 stop:433 length:177 start_codon:yes stop_codon:yes gene_type:complete